jgi:hypothetical protein
VSARGVLALLVLLSATAHGQEPPSSPSPPTAEAPPEKDTRAWRSRGGEAEEVPAGVLARVAGHRGRAACPDATAATGEAARCAPDPEPRERIEIDWDAPTAP